jgi:hypothetical protein
LTHFSEEEGGYIIFISATINRQYIFSPEGKLYCDFKIPSINYKWDYTFKKKKYLKDGNESQDILYFKILKYHCVLKILSYQVNELLPNQNTLFIKPYGELRYSKNINDNRMNIQTYNKHWSIYDFLHLHGFDYIIFQLHKIKSLSEDNECLNFYLYKTLSFILEYIQIADDYIFSMTNNKIKIELKFVVFYLNLIIILNSKKRSYDLNENIRKILLEFIEVFRNKKAMILQKMNFCILFDTKLFKTNQFINYNKLFDEMLWHLDNNDKDNSLFLFYKILLFDNFFEISSKEVKHKKYMKIISKFISDNKRAKTKSLINENFIKYFINVKSPKKIYHYLKIIYYELNSIKSLYKENIDFINYIMQLKENVLETMGCIFNAVQDLEKTDAFVPYAKSTVIFINKILRDETQLNIDIIRNALAIIADFCRVYGTNIKPILNITLLKNIIEKSKNDKEKMKDKEFQDFILWAQKIISDVVIKN